MSWLRKGAACAGIVRTQVRTRNSSFLKSIIAYIDKARPDFIPDEGLLIQWNLKPGKTVSGPVLLEE